MQKEHIYSKVGRSACVGQNDTYSDKKVSEESREVLEKFSILQLE